MILGQDEEEVLARVELQPLRYRTKRPETKVNLYNIHLNIFH